MCFTPPARRGHVGPDQRAHHLQAGADGKRQQALPHVGADLGQAHLFGAPASALVSIRRWSYSLTQLLRILHTADGSGATWRSVNSAATLPMKLSSWALECSALLSMETSS
jgi:hypothetical protein